MARASRFPTRGPAIAALSLIAGLLTALAFPPFGFLPGLLGYGLLMRLLDVAGPERSWRSAFWRGWLAGCAFFLVSTWWVGAAFLVDAKNQAWMAPIAVALLAAGLGLFWGLAGLLYRALRPQGALRVLVFGGCFCLVEWLRGHVLTGFPWDLAGESWAAGSAPSQAAALVGAYGLSWITVTAAAAPAMLADIAPSRQTWLAAGLGVLAIAGLYAFGLHRLERTTPAAQNAPVVRVVQARIEQTDKWDEQMFRNILQRYVTLTGRPAAHIPDVVIWPEGALPVAANDYLADGTWTKALIESALRPGQTLLVGAYRVAGPPDRPIYFNTLLALHDLDGDLQTTAVYDKFRLVPFGEYLPFDHLMEKLGIKALTHLGDSYSPGPGPRSILPPGLPRVQPLICYESIFPGFTQAAARKDGRAAWIVNVSNDAWYGHTYGSAQHLNLARYRALEEGLPLVMATPTGISAVVDAYGRIAPGQRLDDDVMGVIDAPLPSALISTPFAAHGESLFWLMIIVSAVAAAAAYRRTRSVRTPNYVTGEK